MIQIIGFLLCAALAVKLLEMSANPAMLNDESPKPSFMAALIIGWASVFGFAFWFWDQGAVIQQNQTDAQITADCVMSAPSVEAMQDCY